MSLSEEERKAIVDYRIERAQKSFEEATNVMAMGMWSLLANRLYYSLYYALVALLIKDGYVSKTHSGMIALIYQHYVRTGILTAEEGRLVKKMFDLRQESDYDDFVYVDGDEITPFVPQVKELMMKIINIAK